jgi:hypothetical protein
MEKIGKPQRLVDRAAGELLMKVPILRGAGEESLQDWMTVGSGRKLEAIKARKEKLKQDSRDIEEEWGRWDDVLSPEFVKYAREKKFIRFLCPRGCSPFI